MQYLFLLLLLLLLLLLFGCCCIVVNDNVNEVVIDVDIPAAEVVSLVAVKTG